MQRLLHLLSQNENLSEYSSQSDLEQSYQQFGCDGLELIRDGEDDRAIIRPQTVFGYHLPFYADWMDFWRGDRAALERKFGSLEVCSKFYGGENAEILLSMFRQELDRAQAMGVRYVVLHVSNVTLEECFSDLFSYTDTQVVDAAAELVNLLFDGQGYTFALLLENLHWPGLNLKDPAVTQRLLERIHYPNKGLMLDTGHLMCTNLELATPEQACAYIHHVLDQHEDLCHYIKGVHLHQSLSGAYVKKMRRNPPALEPEYYARFAQVYRYVLKIDRHEPMTCPDARRLIERINPDYLVYEFAAAGRAEREKKLSEQASLWGQQDNT